MREVRSGVYNPNPEKCCEACVFGRGRHSAWCVHSCINDYLEQSTSSEREWLIAAGAVHCYGEVGDITAGQQRLLAEVREQVAPVEAYADCGIEEAPKPLKPRDRARISIFGKEKR